MRVGWSTAAASPRARRPPLGRSHTYTHARTGPVECAAAATLPPEPRIGRFGAGQPAPAPTQARAASPCVARRTQPSWAPWTPRDFGVSDAPSAPSDGGARRLARGSPAFPRAGSRSEKQSVANRRAAISLRGDRLTGLRRRAAATRRRVWPTGLGPPASQRQQKQLVCLRKRWLCLAFIPEKYPAPRLPAGSIYVFSSKLFSV